MNSITRIRLVGALGALLIGLPLAAADDLTVTSPNGGELWNPGEEVTVTWDWSSTSGDRQFLVELYLAGDLVQQLGETGYGARSLTWTVCAAMPTSADYTIRVTTYRSSPSAEDFSDAPFTILGVTGVTLVSPNGGEALTAGLTHDIAWTPATGPGYVDAWLYKNGQRDVHIGMDVASNGAMSWKVPRRMEPADWTIEIAWLTPCGFVYKDTSDAPFAVVGQLPRPTLAVTRPAGGEIFHADTTEAILWTATDPVGDVEIWHGDDLVGVAPMAAGQFDWAITPCVANGDSNGIELRWTEAGRTVAAHSVGLFTIHQAFEPVLSSVATDLPPAPVQDETYEVTWTSSADHGRVDVDVVREGAVVQHLGSVDAGAGAIPWVFRSATTSALNGVSVRVRMGACCASAESVPLTIPASGFTTITFTAPTGQTWPAGSQQTVQWDAHGFDGMVELKLPDVVGAHWGVVRAPAAAGSYAWLIPQTVAPGTYQVSVRPADCIVDNWAAVTTTTTVTIGPAVGVFGDTDDDGDVDLRDLARLQRCFVGDAYDLLTPPCDYFDVQPDGYSDLLDFFQMQQAISGPLLAD